MVSIHVNPHLPYSREKLYLFEQHSSFMARHSLKNSNLRNGSELRNDCEVQNGCDDPE